MRSPRASVLAAVGLLPLWPTLSAAQTALVDNRAASYATGDPLASAGQASAHAFTLGATDHRLRSVSVNVRLYAASVIAVKLWSGAGNTPVTLVEDLGTVSNAPLGASNIEFTSATRPLLAANTRYWVSVANVSGDFDWNLTTSTTNSGSGAAFDNLSRESGNGGTAWPNAGVSGQYHQFAVFGTPAIPGNVDTAFGADWNGTDNSIRSVAIQPDGKILIGGHFSSVSDSAGTSNRSRIARLHADGTVDTAFGADGKGASGSVNSIAVQADGKILVGGFFTTVSDATDTHFRNCVARFNADGTVDTAFGAVGMGAGGTVTSIAVQADGQILIGGSFTDVSDGAATHNRSHIARLHADGTVDTTFGAEGTGTDQTVSCVKVQVDGKILIGGNFTNVSDATGSRDRRRIARLHADGTVDTTFGAEGKGTNAEVSSIAVQADGKILIGGFFTDVSDAAATHNRATIARHHADGTVDTAFGAEGTGTNLVVSSLAIQADGKILIGGDFTRVSDATGSYNRRKIARLHADGTIDTAFGVDLAGPNHAIHSVAVQADGKIVIGGNFTEVFDAATNHNRNCFARLENGTASSRGSVPDLTRVRWLRDGTAPEVDRVIAEVSLDGGLTHTLLGTLGRIDGGWELTRARIPAACVLRLRAVHANGGSGSGIIDQAVNVNLTRSPRLTLTGKANLTTRRSRLTLRGTASDPDGDLTAVRFKDSGGKSRSAKGVANWTAKAKLKPGRNTILITAYDSRNVASAMKRVKVKRS